MSRRRKPNTKRRHPKSRTAERRLAESMAEQHTALLHDRQGFTTPEQREAIRRASIVNARRAIEQARR